MLQTPLCDLLGIDVPVILAPFGPWEEVELAAAVCEAGGLGSLGTAARTVPELRAQWAGLRERTDRPFAINHTGRPFDPEAFAATVAFGPAAISFHMGFPADLIQQAHDKGIKWLQTVGEVEAAEHAVAAGADVLIAQGGEAGGHAGWISTMVLVPAVADVAGDIPVVAAGGIADGRGLAAALALGAQGACLGTRFLATTAMTIDAAWKQRIVSGNALDAVKVSNSGRILAPFTLPQSGRPCAPRALRTTLTDQLEHDPSAVDAEQVRAQFLADVRRGGGHDILPFTGQSAELIHDIPAASDLVARLVADAEHALRSAAAGITPASRA